MRMWQLALAMPITESNCGPPDLFLARALLDESKTEIGI